MNEEYKDSLEMADANRIHNAEENKGELLDTVEQDSLEINKIDATNLTNDGIKPFLPFAKVGTEWSNDCAAQNNTTEQNSDTNYNVAIETTNTINEITNSKISTNQMIDEEFRDLPGIKWQTNFICFFVHKICPKCFSELEKNKIKTKFDYFRIDS